MGNIHYEAESGVATITIDRPEKRNAMTYAVLHDFYDAVARAGDDDDVRVVVITGAGGAFCAGTDLSDLAGTPEDERSTQGRRDGERPAWPIVSCPKPVIAAVDGPAVGMGAEFALQCDVRIASTRARFAWNFVHRGLVPDTGAGSWILPRLVGPATALRILYSGEFIDADEALRLGLVVSVVEPDELAAAASAEAQRFLAGSPFSMRRIKRLVYEGLEMSMKEHLERSAAALQECFASEDHREGVAAFLERREPGFTGR